MKRFWDKVNKTSDCWEWLGHIQKHGLGYGSFRYNGRMHNAHRIAWMLHTGIYPQNKTICHKCDNPRCVNPDHLFEGTQQDNIKDMIQKGRNRGAKGERNSHNKLSKEQVEEIRRLYATGNYTQMQLSKMFPVGKTMIGNIVTGTAWK